jgi:hypothetical protein
LARDVSLLNPAAPYIYIALSIILQAIFGATTFIIAISFFAFFVPNLSIKSAHLKVNKRAYSISILDCAISN